MTQIIATVHPIHLTYADQPRQTAADPQARFPSKRNRLRCVRCVWMETGLNASACVGKQPIMVAAASTEHSIGCCQTQRTQRTQRKRLRLDGNRASDQTNRPGLRVRL